MRFRTDRLPRTLAGAVTTGLLVCGLAAGCSSTDNPPTTADNATTQPPVSMSVESSAVPASTTSPSTTSPRVNLHDVDWSAVTVPGAVCGLNGPVTLSGGKATVDAPQLHAGTPQVLITDNTGNGQPAPVYGDLNGDGRDEAAILVWCSNTGGTAAGQLADSIVVYSADSGEAQPIGTLRTQQPPATPPVHSALIDGTVLPTFGPHTVTVHELWYSATDADCCPSTHATTVWTQNGDAFQSQTTVEN